MIFDLIDEKPLAEGDVTQINGVNFKYINDILREEAIYSPEQEQTSAVFNYKWHKTDSYESKAFREKARNWLIARYGDPSNYSWLTTNNPILLDAGVGAGFSALELFRDILDKVRFVGVDISNSIDVVRQRFIREGFKGAFLQADLNNIPFKKESVDIIFSEGVLHHTDSTRNSFKKLATLLKKGGHFMFYIYRKKGPLREFCDDHIRDQLKNMTCDHAWKQMKSLSKLGKILGELDIEIDIPEAIDVLKIPAGKINLQRFFYWHVFKAFYDPSLTLDEITHINYDWYAPKNAHRHTEDEIKQWCAEENFKIEQIKVEEAGITVIAKKLAGDSPYND